MSDLYSRFRAEVAAGGGAGNITPRDNPWVGRLVGIGVLGLLIWLGVRSPWTLLFVAGLLLSVFLHEVGHFVTARRTGMKATQFFMGFGPRLWSRHHNGVEYGFRALPLGAYVRIIGMNNLDEVEPRDEPYAYRNKSYPRRLLVITAGSLMHLVIGMLLFVGVYSIGGHQRETGKVTVDLVATAAGSQPSPAELAGIRAGDVVTSFDGVVVTSRTELVDNIVKAQPGDVVEVGVLRDGTSRTFTVTLGANPVDATVAYLGVATSSLGSVRLGPLEAVTQGLSDIGDTISQSVKGLGTVLNPVNTIEHLRDEDADQTTRPTTVVGISQVSGDIGRNSGASGVLLLMANLNIFVGVFNMFPLLPFDGGHAAIATYERLRSRKGKPYHADVSKMMPVTTVVVAILLFLMVSGLYLDVVRPL